MGKASQEAYERGFMAGAQHERLHHDIEAWRCKCHDVPYKKAPPLGEYASKAVAHVETDPKTNEQSDFALDAYAYLKFGIGEPEPAVLPPTKPHVLTADEDHETYNLCTIHPAHPASVKLVLDAPERTEDGRSEWLWCRFANGDLMLGLFPRGETYELVERYAEYPGDVA